MPAGYRCMCAYWLGGAGPGIEVAITTKLPDARQVVKRVHTPATNKLELQFMGTADTGGTDQDWENVIKNIFNDVSNQLRVSSI